MGRRKWDKIRRKRQREIAEKNAAESSKRREEWLQGMLQALGAMSTAIEKGEIQDTPAEREKFINEYCKDPKVAKTMELLQGKDVQEIRKQCEEIDLVGRLCDEISEVVEPRPVTITTTGGTGELP